jgi:hypothetical protein
VSKIECRPTSTFDQITVFALLAASVDHTYHGSSIKYIPGGPVSGVS